MTIDRKLAARAAKLAAAGMKGKAIGAELGVSTFDANQLAAVGSAYARLEKLPLTQPEILLLRMLAQEERELLAVGATRSPESKRVSWRASKSPSWAAATAQKRMFDARYDEKVGRTVRGLGFVNVAGNGYIRLTPAGWAVVAAMEAAERSASLAAQTEIAELRDIIADFLRAHADGTGLIDCIDNQGERYTSQFLDDTIHRARLAADTAMRPRAGRRECLI